MNRKPKFTVSFLLFLIYAGVWNGSTEHPYLLSSINHWLIPPSNAQDFEDDEFFDDFESEPLEEGDSYSSEGADSVSEDEFLFDESPPAEDDFLSDPETIDETEETFWNEGAEKNGNPFEDEEVTFSEDQPFQEGEAQKELVLEVNQFPVKVIRRSSSTRVYLLEDPESGIVQERNVFLLRKGLENVMAFRAIKLYPDLSQFAARHVRKYPGWDVLEPDDRFTALDKIGEFYRELTPQERQEDEMDLLDIESQMTPEDRFEEDLMEWDDESSGEVDDDGFLFEEDLGDPPPSEDDFLFDVKSGDNDSKEDDFLAEDFDGEDETQSAAVEENEKESIELPNILAYDEELDAGTSPEPKDQLAELNDQQERLELANLVVDEIYPIERDKNWFSLGFGYFNVGTLTGTSAFFSGVGIRYGYNLGDHLFVYQKSLQDSFTLELGAYLYTVSGFASTADNYTVAPLLGTARYNLYIGKSLITFVYAGISMSTVTSSTGGTELANEALSGFGPAFGGGMFIHIGPKWYVRFDLGLDFVGSGLVLKI